MPDTTTNSARHLETRIQELQRLIAAARGLRQQIALLERQVDGWASELNRQGKPPSEGLLRVRAELAEKRRAMELAQQARQELAAIDPILLRGLLTGAS